MGHRLAPPRSFSRHASALIFLSVAALFFAACGNASSSTTSGPVNLTYWSFGVDMQPSVTLFEQSHPNIHVTVQQIAGDVTTKLITAIKAGNAPDDARIEADFLPSVEVTGGLVDLTKYGANDLKSQFVPWTWSEVSRGNAVYAIPEDTGPEALYYRADIFTKYNLPVPTTWAQYADDAAKLHAADPNAYITDFAPSNPGWFIGLAWQNGAQWFTTSGNSWQVNINDAPTKQVASYWQNLISQKLVKTETDFSDAWNADLTSGNVATWISAVWGTGFLASAAPKSSGDWQIAPMPQWTAGQNAAGNWGGSTTAVTKGSKHPKEAAEFAEFLDGNLQSVSTNLTKNGLYPAFQPGLADPSLSQPQAFYGNQVVYPIFKQASQGVNESWNWGPTMPQVYNSINDNFTKVLNGQISLPDAFDAVESSTVQDMTAQGFSVQH